MCGGAGKESVPQLPVAAPPQKMLKEVERGFWHNFQSEGIYTQLMSCLTIFADFWNREGTSPSPCDVTIASYGNIKNLSIYIQNTMQETPTQFTSFLGFTTILGVDGRRQGNVS